MTLPGLPEGVEILEYVPGLKEPAFVFMNGYVTRQSGIGPFYRCQPVPGYTFVYDHTIDGYIAHRELDRPITYRIELQAKDTQGLKEIQSILDSLAKHTRVFCNFERRESE